MLKTKKSGFTFLADIEKAFDSVCRDFLHSSLQKFNFGPFCIEWFLTLHNQSTARLIINGHLSGYVDINSGVRQGCPWAPLLFLAATEPLACNIRNSNIGIELSDTKLSYMGYADDTCCYLASLLEIDTLFKIFHTYKDVSGLNLNDTKSVILPLDEYVGINKPSSLPCKWIAPGDHEPLLGIQVGSLYNDDLSWNEMIRKVYRSIQQWIPKYLPVFGRVCAAKSYIASKSWYLASVIPPKPKTVSKLNAVLWNFIHNHSCLQEDAPTIRYYARWSAQTLRQPLQIGGLNAQQYDFQLSALHSKWIFSLLNPATTTSWTSLPLRIWLELV
jgi:hypothetical protein